MKPLLRRLLIGAALLLLLPGTAFAQEDGTIAGRITDAQTGDPLPGATVQIQDMQVGAATDANGEYEIEVEAGSYTLSISFVGYQAVQRSVDVEAGETTEVNAALEISQTQLEGVAVTALGFEANRDELGASQASIDAAAIENTAETSVLKSLSAKATGVQITSFGGDPGAGARIVIRGAKTIQGDNQPLVVVDGVPVSNQTFGEGTDGVQQQSRLNDIPPEDIASVEILKGASAAALWGSRAQNGVIVIETKSGQYAEKTSVSFRTSVGFDELSNTQNLQRSFGQGFGGLYAQGSAFSWGDEIAGRSGGADAVNDGATDPVAIGQQTGQRYYTIDDGTAANPHGGKNTRETVDQGSALFDNGYTVENTLSINGGGEDGRYYLSLSRSDVQGIIPENSDYNRTSVRLNADRQVTSDLTFSAVGNYVRTNSARAQQGSNLSGLLLGQYRTAPDFNNQDYLVDYYPSGLDGAVVEDAHRAYRNPLGASFAPVYDNPFFTINKNTNNSTVNRLLGKVEASYDPIDWINLTTRFGVDYYEDRRQVLFPIRNASFPTGIAEEDSYGEFRYNIDFIGRATRDLTSDISATALAGFSYSRRDFDRLQGEVLDFSNPVEIRSLTNGTAENQAPFTEQSTQVTAGVFAELSFDLYEQVFIKGTGRVDQASTFGPETDDTFFYPSGQIAWQFSDLLPDSDLFTFGKLRASAARVGREPGPYQAFSYFFPSSYFDGYTGTTLAASGYGGGFEQSSLLGNPFIIPEETTEYEAGVDLRFLNDRLQFGATYYTNTSRDVIFGVDIAPSTGFTNQTQNAATIENTGIELDLTAEWPKVGDFGWTTDLRWETNDNTVTNLAGVSEVGLAGFTSATSSLVEGEPFGVLFGNRWRRADFAPVTTTEEAAGFTVAPDGRVLSPDGFPLQAATQGKIGNPQADWRAGIGNTFSYKGVSLRTLFDFKIGGDVWNGTKGALFFFGRHTDQAQMTTISEEVANSATNFFGCTVADLASDNCSGYTSNARQNDDGSYTFRGFVEDFGAGDRIVDGPFYWSGPGSGFTGPGEQFIEDGSWVRLREVSLSYNWGNEFVQRSGLSSIDFTLTARNLWLSTDYSGIDPETNLTGPSNGQGLDYFNNPNTRSYRVSVRVNY
ncbi:MAG: SusC/RagA family TonB-linked outer membrane protein [Bacteroidetes bacterium]|jgi:TonB-linked SusC/RagA family outer membrane protein|nr:SusC/RagA family TonB-linked outer membrane protein [Bacteroidota bacterium]